MLLWKSLKNKINQNGGFANAHAHFDRAYTLTEKDMHDVVYNQLEEKWRVVDGFKRSASVKQYYDNMSLALGFQKAYGVSSCLSFIDIDPVCGDKAILAATTAKLFAEKEGINFKVACQTYH